jgi:4-oxalocrotonate tautomerase
VPHVISKLASGRSEQEKARLAEAITRAVMAGANCADDSVSLSIEDVEPSNWVEEVCIPDIKGKWDSLYKKPGYDPFANIQK